MGTIKDRNGKERPNRSKDDQEVMKRMHRKKCTKKELNDLDNNDGVVSHSETEIWCVKSSGPLEALLSINLVEVMEFQQSYLES